MLNHEQAKNEIKKQFNDTWLAGLIAGFNSSGASYAPLIFRTNQNVVYQPTIYWQNVQTVLDSDNERHFSRFSVMTNLTEQSAMSGRSYSVPGNKHTTFGLVVVELFFAKSAYSAGEESFLSLLSRKAFASRQTPNGVWFRNSTIRELRPEDSFFRSNVLTEFQYDSVD